MFFAAWKAEQYGSYKLLRLLLARGRIIIMEMLEKKPRVR